MIGYNSSDYYRRRAAQAERLAAAAVLPEVRVIHRQMAERYAALADEGNTIEPEPVAPADIRPRLRMAY